LIVVDRSAIQRWIAERSTTIESFAEAAVSSLVSSAPAQQNESL
jgi:hypothetical protein